MCDASIVAAAGFSSCAVLCSEGMQDGLNFTLPEWAGGISFSINDPFVWLSHGLANHCP